MATVDDVRELVLALPGVVEAATGHRSSIGWRVADAQFAWVRGPSKADLKALAALGRSWPDGPVIGLRTDGLTAKEELLAALPGILFTIPHFDGYPAVLVELDRVDREQLAELLADAWLLKAPKAVAKAWLAEHGLDAPAD